MKKLFSVKFRRNMALTMAIIFRIVNFALLFIAGYRSQMFFRHEPVTFAKVAYILLLICGGIAAGFNSERRLDDFAFYRSLAKLEE